MTTMPTNTAPSVPAKAVRTAFASMAGGFVATTPRRDTPPAPPRPASAA